MAKWLLFDIEANGLKPTHIWCMAYHWVGTDKKGSTTSYDEMRRIFEEADYIVGHNIILFDVPVVERLLGIKIRAKLVDTLALSWYLYPKRPRHGLDQWGETFGIEKPPIENWDDLPIEDYLFRCEEDVKINMKLWLKQRTYLKKIYGDVPKALAFIEYLSFKMSCAREQEEMKWKLDVVKAKATLVRLERDKEDRTAKLMEVMPKVPIISKRTRPKKPYKANGELSALGEKWFNLLKEKRLPDYYMGSVEVIGGYKDPNPSSSKQRKDWLFSMGWKPETFKYVRDKDTNEVRKIEQVNKEHGGGVCPSVLKLANKCPDVVLLDGLAVISHRISILKGFLDAVDHDGYVYAGIGGLTNTLRFKHRILVNLPGVDKDYGEDIRGCLIAPEGYVLFGSDMSSLEDRTKQHYMWDHDPDYVTEMNKPDFDPHLDLAAMAKMCSVADIARHKAGEIDLGKIRKKAKSANYACTYGAQAPTVARTAGIAVAEAEELVNAYWERNWSLKAIADSCKVKEVDGDLWLYNPVSQFWYSLRHDKDRFSTLNQSSGVYCFDRWVFYVRSRKLKLIGQFHDEIIGLVKPEHQEKLKGVLNWAIKQVNTELRLNRELGVDIQFGKNYAQIH